MSPNFKLLGEGPYLNDPTTNGQKSQDQIFKIKPNYTIGQRTYKTENSLD